MSTVLGVAATRLTISRTPFMPGEAPSSSLATAAGRLERSWVRPFKRYLFTAFCSTETISLCSKGFVT